MQVLTLLKQQAAEEAEESARKMAAAAHAMRGLFGKPPNMDDKKAFAKTPSKTPAKKRKRESPAPEGEAEKPAEGEASSVKPTKPPFKRSKTETPVPAPLPISTGRASPLAQAESAPSIASETVVTPLDGPSDLLAVPAPLPSPKKSSTPILPPTKESRKPAKKDVKKPVVETATNTRPRRTSAAATPAPVEEPLPLKRPTSSRSKAASVEPAGPTATATATIDRPRRASTARNTPAPEPRQPSKRTKRPAPGVVTAGSEGSTAVSVGKRSAATRKKAGTKKEKKDGREGSAAQEIYDEVDDEGNIIDPDEPRYCLCNRVSFGTMIGCENNDVSLSFLFLIKKMLISIKCEKEWFHLECVGLDEIPPRTTKWYCPDCRVTLGIGEKGEVNARGKKK